MGLLDSLIYGLRDVLDASLALLPRRSRLRFVGGPGVSIAFADDATNQAAQVTLSRDPMHVEGEAIFRDASDSRTAAAPAIGESRSLWTEVATTNATPAVLRTESIPAAVIGDVDVTCTFVVSVASAAGGGKMSIESRFRRTSGTLSKVGSDAATTVTAPDIAVSIATNVVSNDSFALKGTGIAATNINWTTSAHLQITKIPS